MSLISEVVAVVGLLQKMRMDYAGPLYTVQPGLL